MNNCASNVEYLEKIKKANKPRDSVNYKLVTAG